MAVDVTLDNELRGAFMAIQIGFLAAVNQEDRRATFQHQLHDLTVRAAFAISNNLIPSETTDFIRSVVLGIHHLSVNCVEWCDTSGRISAELVARLKCTLGPSTPPRAPEGRP